MSTGTTAPPGANPAEDRLREHIRRFAMCVETVAHFANAEVGPRQLKLSDQEWAACWLCGEEFEPNELVQRLACMCAHADPSMFAHYGYTCPRFETIEAGLRVEYEEVYGEEPPSTPRWWATRLPEPVDGDMHNPVTFAGRRDPEATA